jgi:protein SCO1
LKKLLFYIVFFVVLVSAFLFFVFKDEDLSKSLLPVINANVEDFSFTDQDGKPVTQNNVDGKVYVAEYFFTTCKGICPIMNSNMRRVYDEYKDEPGFMILSHTCMPETDSVPLLKAYEEKMLNGKLEKKDDGSYRIKYDTAGSHQPANNTNWSFVTGDKEQLYKMARQSYMIDNNKPSPSQNMSDQFLHSQFFALVDKQRRVRGIYDGLQEDEIQKLLKDIKGLLKEKVTSKRFMNGFSNNPN